MKPYTVLYYGAWSTPLSIETTLPSLIQDLLSKDVHNFSVNMIPNAIGELDIYTNENLMNSLPVLCYCKDDLNIRFSNPNYESGAYIVHDNKILYHEGETPLHKMDNPFLKSSPNKFYVRRNFSEIIDDFLQVGFELYAYDYERQISTKIRLDSLK